MKVFDYDSFKTADYERDFWTGRDYEDSIERMALEKLLPIKGQRIIDIGGGYGRLTSTYIDRFAEVTIFDYAASLLDKAKLKWGSNSKVAIVQGDLYALPFPDQHFDAVLMVRVMHHLDDVPRAFKEISRVIKPGGHFIFEYANKRNLLEILRLISGRPNIQPFNKQPTERQPLYFNFHPAYIDEIVANSGFEKEKELSVSNFRMDLIKKIVSPLVLAQIEFALAGPLSILKLSPSVIVRCRAVK